MLSIKDARTKSLYKNNMIKQEMFCRFFFKFDIKLSVQNCIFKYKAVLLRAVATCLLTDEQTKKSTETALLF